MSKLFSRILLSFSVILSIGYTEIFSAVAQVKDYSEQSEEQVDLQHQIQHVFTQSLDHVIIKSGELGQVNSSQTWKNENLDEKNEDLFGKIKVQSFDFHFAEFFKSLVLGDLDNYSTKILHFCKNISPISAPRIHLVNGVFLI